MVLLEERLHSILPMLMSRIAGNLHHVGKLYRGSRELLLTPAPERENPPELFGNLLELLLVSRRGWPPQITARMHRKAELLKLSDYG